MLFGSEISLQPDLNYFEKTYIKLFGVPILGLRIRARTIIPFFKKIKKPERVVDVGSGRGMITLSCARQFPNADVIGIDLNDGQNTLNNELAEKIDQFNLHFKTFDAMQLTRLGRFDLVISTDMLEHLENDLNGVKLFYDSLNTGGYLLVHVPHLTRNTFGWKRQNWMDIEGHVRPGYTKKGLIDLLGRGGFKVIECIYNYNHFETLANDLSKFITRAKEQNKAIYALFFPILLLISWLGINLTPKNDGSGLVALACKEN